MARREGFGHVATTLAVSPYQLFDVCNEVLGRLAAAQGLTPVIRDFRPWYPEATRKSRELGMFLGCRGGARSGPRPRCAPVVPDLSIA